MATNCSCGIKQQKLQYHCGGQIEAIFMRAYIMILALPVFAMLALVYAARTHDRTYAGFNCTVDCSGHEAGYRWAEQHSLRLLPLESSAARSAISLHVLLTSDEPSDQCLQDIGVIWFAPVRATNWKTW